MKNYAKDLFCYMLNDQYHKSSRVPRRCCDDDCGGLFFHLFLVICGFTNFWVFAFVNFKQPLNIVLAAIFIFCFLQQTRCFVTAFKMDPGYVVDESKHKQSDDTTCCNKDAQEILNIQVEQPAESVVMEDHVVEDTTRRPGEYCHLCQQYKPPRAHHCSQCNRCVARYDHHCPFIGNCIGEKNFRYFFKFCLYATITSGMSIICSMIGYFMEVNRIGQNQSLGGAMKMALGGISMVFSLIGFLFPCGMASSNCCSIIADFTTIERKIRKYDAKMGKYVEKTVHDMEKCSDYLGKNWFVSLLLL